MISARQLRRSRWWWLGVLCVTIVALAACERAPAAPTATPPPPLVTRPPLPTATLAPSPTATEPLPTLTPTPITPVEGNALELIQAFVEAPYRVVAVARNPFAPYSLIVAAERSAAECGSPEQPQRCTADETCGSFYTSPTCFFFIEPAFDATADPSTRYVARWPDEPTLAALVLDSFRFIDPRTVEFRAEGGDGGGSVVETWWLDMVTGALAMQSRVEQ